MSEKQSQSHRPRSRGASERDRSSIDIIAKLVPAVVAATYFYGFLILTSHLGDFGITTAGILDTSYFVAGATFLYLIAVFGVFVLRPLRSIEPLITAGPRAMSEDTEPMLAHVICFRLYLLIEVCVHICVAAFVFSFVFVDSRQGESSWSTLLILMVFSGYLTERIDKRLSHYNLASASRIVVIAFFVKKVATPDTWHAIGLLAGILVLVHLAKKEIRNRANSPEQRAYLAGFCAIMLISIAIWFGHVTYGKINRSYGGGAPVSAAISLDRSQIGRNEIIDESLIMANLVHISNTDLYLVLADSQHIVLSRSIVVWIKLLDSE